MDQDRLNKEQRDWMKQKIMAELGVQGQLPKEGGNQAAAGFPSSTPNFQNKGQPYWRNFNNQWNNTSKP